MFFQKEVHPVIRMETSTIKSKTREDIFTEYYVAVFPGVAAFVKKSGGTLEDARDIFQDAILALHEKKRNPENLILEEHAYLMGIAKNCWRKRIDQAGKLPKTSLKSSELAMPDEYEPQASEKIYEYLGRVGKKCMDLLKGFYYDRLNMNELAEKFGFSGERSATVQKHKCLQKVREEVHSKFLKKEDFYE